MGGLLAQLVGYAKELGGSPVCRRSHAARRRARLTRICGPHQPCAAGLFVTVTYCWLYGEREEGWSITGYRADGPVASVVHAVEVAARFQSLNE
jgi:hypothetical protein